MNEELQQALVTYQSLIDELERLEDRKKKEMIAIRDKYQPELKALHEQQGEAAKIIQESLNVEALAKHFIALVQPHVSHTLHYRIEMKEAPRFSYSKSIPVDASPEIVIYWEAPYYGKSKMDQIHDAFDSVLSTSLFGNDDDEIVEVANYTDHYWSEFQASYSPLSLAWGGIETFVHDLVQRIEGYIFDPQNDE